MQEQFMRDFFTRQREIGKQAMETTKLLARTNIESILICGLESPPTIERMEEVLEELRAEKIKQAEEELERLKGEAINGEQV